MHSYTEYFKTQAANEIAELNALRDAGELTPAEGAAQ